MKKQQKRKTGAAKESVPTKGAGGKGGRDPSVTHSRREKDARARGGKPAKSARGVGPPCEKCGQIHKRCSAHNRAGGPCGQQPLRFSQVCRSHGGSTKQSRQAAQERMMELVWPAIARLDQLVRDPNTDPAIVVKVVAQILDRAHGAGLSRNASLSVGFAEETMWDRLTGDGSPAFRIERGTEAVTVGSDEPQALPGGGGEATEEELAAFLEHRERAREREAATRLDNSGHDVVPGAVDDPDPAAGLFGYPLTDAQRRKMSDYPTEHDPHPTEGDRWADYESEIKRRSGDGR